MGPPKTPPVEADPLVTGLAGSGPVGDDTTSASRTSTDTEGEAVHGGDALVAPCDGTSAEGLETAHALPSIPLASSTVMGAVPRTAVAEEGKSDDTACECLEDADSSSRRQRRP